MQNTILVRAVALLSPLTMYPTRSPMGLAISSATLVATPTAARRLIGREEWSKQGEVGSGEVRKFVAGVWKRRKEGMIK